MIVVADTSPITALLHLKRLPLLETLYGHIYIPATVAEELQTLVQFGYDVSFLKDTERYVVREAKDLLLMQALSKYLDAGEVEAIALAKELKADLLEYINLSSVQPAKTILFNPQYHHEKELLFVYPRAHEPQRQYPEVYAH